MLLADAFSKIISLRETVIAQVSRYWKLARNFQYRRNNNDKKVFQLNKKIFSEGVCFSPEKFQKP